MARELVKLKNSVTERDHISGAQDAPVTLLEYGNFECIHCGSAYPAIKEVKKVLGVNLRFVFRHFPIVQTHPHSLRAAEAAEAAGAQGKFWEMHDQLFAHQPALEDHNLSRYAKHIGLDVERFARDMAENMYRALWSWIICVLVTVLVSIATRPKPVAELVGLVYGVTEIPSEEQVAIYRRPVFWAVVVAIVFLVLNIIFW